MLAALALTATQSVAHPTGPDHGVNETTYVTLWSGDEDRGTASDLPRQAERRSLAILAAGTDVPFDSPPSAAGKWNRGDLRDFPATNASTSIHPPNATLRDGRFLRDAYVEIFALTPSTRAHLSSSTAPLYVAPEGRTLGTVDYRVAVPRNNTTGNRRVRWSLRHHHVETRLLVDGRLVANTTGTHTPSLKFTQRGGIFGENHTFTLESDVNATLRKQVRTCTERDEQTGVCTAWNETISFPSDTVTVQDALEVRSYNLAIGGFRAEYPNGDLGLVLYKAQPWAGYSTPSGEVRGVWRFYTARDATWDTLVTSTATGNSTGHSPLHPLQVHAYPIETGPTAAPSGTISILETYGQTTAPPTLPEGVHLDVLEEPYTASYGIATRVETSNHDLSGVEAMGLVRGVSARADEGVFIDVPINESELALSVVNQTAETVTVEVELSDAVTGAPINTGQRGGHVVIGGERVETNANGTVRKTLYRPPSGISARYEPGQWWLNVPGYTSDSDVVYVRGTVLAFLGTLSGVAVPISMLLLSAYLIDRLTGWDLWPPWRRL